jgi:hypothetical protein
MNETKPTATPGLYETDFHAWSNEQARRLRQLKPEGLDWENVAEEIKSLGRSDKRAIASDLNVIWNILSSGATSPTCEPGVGHGRSTSNATASLA